MAWLEHWLTRQWLQRGPWAWSMWPLHQLMLAVVTARRRAALQGRRPVRVLPVPVVVVGNRIVGGAGKTPTTLALIAHLQSRGWHPGVLSRGHGRSTRADAPTLLDTQSAPTLTAAQTGDECWLIHQRSGVPVGISPDRHAAGLALLTAHPQVDILVCDDALQHLDLARDLEIVVFDERGAGNGWLLPAGLLREPIDAAPGPGTRGPALVLYNADRPSTPLPGHVARREVLAPMPIEVWRRSDRPAEPQAGTWPSLTQGAGLAALAGIAQPERFFQSLRAMGWRFQPLALADHADFDPLPWPPEVPDLIVTEKDAVKIGAEALKRQRPGTRVWVAPLQLSLPDRLLDDIDARLPQPPNRH